MPLMLHSVLQTGLQKVSDSVYTKVLGRQQIVSIFPLNSSWQKRFKILENLRERRRNILELCTSPFVWLVAACARPKISIHQRYEKKAEAPCPPGWSRSERLWSRNTWEGWSWSESKLSSPAPSPPWPPPWPCLPHWRSWSRCPQKFVSNCVLRETVSKKKSHLDLSLPDSWLGSTKPISWAQQMLR